MRRMKIQGGGRAARPREGFTLVELLTVVVIIGILASLTVAAVVIVKQKIAVARTRIEVQQLAMAVEAFRIQFGQYPPDTAAEAANFMKTAFPRANAAPGNIDNSTALCYWLAGPNGKGFSANPLDPMDNNVSRIGPFFDFDSSRVKNNQFTPDNGSNKPYIYFCAKNGAYGAAFGGATPTAGVNTNSFQIWAAGPDGTYGDNAVTNFTAGTVADTKKE